VPALPAFLEPVSLPDAPTPTSAPIAIADGGKSYRWNRENYSYQRRFVDIWSFTGRLMATLWRDSKDWSYTGGPTEEKKALRRRAIASWIRETFLELGPTFIKLGQLFSTRADLFPAEYVEELSKLQDRVPAFSFDQVQQIIEQDLGKSLTVLFASVDPVPLAAASLGQVHRAELHSGESVVIKVQRPGLRKLFDVDLRICRGIARYFQNHRKWGQGRDWMGIYDECCRILIEEIDYINEGRNADAFRRNFRSKTWVNVPRVYWRYSSGRVLVLEYMPGIKISHYEALEAAGLDRKLLANLSAEAYLQQILDHGLFHADPHPGNLAVSPEGALIFYDFGMMGRLKSDIRQKLIGTFFGIAQKDATQVVNSLIDLGALVPTEDLSPVRRSIQYMLDNFMDQPLEIQSIDAISEDLYDIAYGQPFRFPATFTFVMRAFSTLEGVGKGLDPDFNFMEAAKPFALDIMANSPGPNVLNELSRQAVQVGNSAFALPRRIEDTLEKLEQGDIRIRVRSQESDRLLRRLGTTQMGTTYAIISGTFLLSATILFASAQGVVANSLAAIALLIGVGCGILMTRLLLRLNRADRL
jgi:predicted unusual protein kinase regulating ubiquinone biosynthesis (AarF/ABC1/UbiB family)